MKTIFRSRTLNPLALFEVLFLVLCLSLAIPASAFAKKADSPADPAKEKKSEASKPVPKPALIQMAENSGADKVALKKSSAKTGEEALSAAETALSPSAPVPITPRIQTPPPHAGFGVPRPMPVRMQTAPAGFNPNPSGTMAKPQSVVPAESLIDKPVKEEMPADIEKKPGEDSVILEEVKPKTEKKAAPPPQKEEKPKKKGKTKTAF